jgi:hypothetical protein
LCFTELSGSPLLIFIASNPSFSLTAKREFDNFRRLVTK